MPGIKGEMMSNKTSFFSPKNRVNNEGLVLNAYLVLGERKGCTLGLVLRFDRKI